MSGRLLQILGVLAIVTLCGVAVAGLLVLKDRVRVVIQDDQPDAGPDATALLRDDVQVLARDLQALQQAVVQNFGQLASGLDGNAATRHEDVLALRGEATAQHQQVTTLMASMQQLQGRFAGLEQRLAELPAVLATAVVTPAVVTPAVDTPAVDTPAVVATGSSGEPGGDRRAAPSDEPIAVPSPPVVEVPARPKTTGFLSFQLPSSGFAFDQPQHYTLLPELCRVGFDAKSTLHDFTGVTSKLRGEFRADWDDAQGLCSGQVVVDARTLQTGVEGRDENMLEHLDTAQHPELQFDLQSFQAKAVDIAARTANGEVLGKMTIRGKSRELRVAVKVSVDAQQRVVIEGQVPLLLSDYGVPVPNQLGLISMEDQVVVWLALRARAQAEAR